MSYKTITAAALAILIGGAEVANADPFVVFGTVGLRVATSNCYWIILIESDDFWAVDYRTHSPGASSGLINLLQPGQFVTIVSDGTPISDCGGLATAGNINSVFTGYQPNASTSTAKPAPSTNMLTR
jgi:hypothetical protein